LIRLELGHAEAPAKLRNQIKLFEKALVKLNRALNKAKPKWSLPPNRKYRVLLQIIGDAAMQKINYEYRHKRKPTDVLSFVYADKKNPPLANEVTGEIFISRDTAHRQAKEFDHSLADELALLAVHGALHVMGYDHERSERAARAMRRSEHEVLKSAGVAPTALTERYG